MTNIVIKVYGLEDGDRAIKATTDDIVKSVKAYMKGAKLRAKSYAANTYQGHRCTFHEWECTRGISIVAHEIYV